MLKRALLFIGVVIAVFLAYVAVQPSEYTISRETVVHAKPEVVFPYMNNVKKTNEWMPWSDMDKEVKMSYAGPEEGVGAISSWESSGQMGVGKATVVESVPNASVKTKIEYFKPMTMQQVSDFTLTPVAEGTKVRWSVNGHNNFVGRVFCVFMNMDKMVGGSFEAGLGKLKKMVEGSAK